MKSNSAQIDVHVITDGFDFPQWCGLFEFIWCLGMWLLSEVSSISELPDLQWGGLVFWLRGCIQCQCCCEVFTIYYGRYGNLYDCTN